jgi:hypothetical protein
MAVWWDHIRDSLRKQCVQELTLTTHPKLLNAAHFQLVDNLLRHTTVNTTVDEVASILRVDQQHFERKITAAKRHRLRKYRTLFQFEKIPLSKLDSVYAFLQKCRAERGQTLSLTFPQLQNMSYSVSKKIQLYGVSNQNKWAAVAIVLQEAKDSWYTFYYGHLSTFDKQSPVVFLLEQLYQLAQNKGMQWINLGTSMLGDTINQPLLHFKTSIGAETTFKRTYIQYL